MSGRALTAVLLLALASACGVKAPPKASGAADKDAPNDIFRPPEDPNRPIRPAEEPTR